MIQNVLKLLSATVVLAVILGLVQDNLWQSINMRPLSWRGLLSLSTGLVATTYILSWVAQLDRDSERP